MAQRTLLLATAVATLLLVSTGVALKADASRAAPDPSLRIDAPERVDVGEPVEIILAVKDVADIAGYETNLLYDTKVAEFASFTQGDLDDFGWDVGPLGPVETRQGVSIGAFSCPVEDCTKPGKGSKAKRGGRGTVELATATIIPNKPGRLELQLDETKFVDAAGDLISVDPGDGRLVVQVGQPDASSSYPAPESVPWELASRSPSRPGPFDLTGDERITNADAMEVAVAWKLLREDGAACEDYPGDPSRDVNRDGCIDVTDSQTIVANYGADKASGAQSTARSGAEGGEGEPNFAAATISSLIGWMAPRPALAAVASTFTVNSETDGADASPGDGTCATTTKGACTLRAAIEEANLHPGPDTIAFNIPGSGVRTIQLGSRLPSINDETGPTTIDGYTQPGSSPNTDPSASNAAIGVQITDPTTYKVAGMTVTSPGNTVRGLSFFKLKNPLLLYGSGAQDNTIAGNFVGTDAAGNYSAGSYIGQADGIYMQNGAKNNNIGGTSVAERNVVSGNAQRGVVSAGETSDSNRIINNIIGLGPKGDKRLPNTVHGVDVNSGSSQNQIGGTQSGERNVISGNGGEGVEISHVSTTTENSVVGNFIGTDVTGKVATDYSYNANWGIHVEDRVTNNTVTGNVVGNNRKGGVRSGRLSKGTVIQNNRIGISLDGRSIPNSSSGVQIDNDSTGSRVGPGNVIANNRIGGVRIQGVGSDRNTITRNSIFGNTGLGIDLEPFGTSEANDSGDADSGPNEQLNFPVLDTAATQKVTGTACGGCTVEVFVADGGAGAYGEGKDFVGSAVSNSGGAFAVAVSGVAEGDYVATTATDTVGNTSEYSPNKVVSSSSDSTAPDTPTGLAAAASQDGVELDWADNTESDLAGYNVYRSTTSGGSYTKITSSLLSSSSYADTEANAGTTYYYVVTATDTAGNESGYSNEDSATQQVAALSFDATDDRVSIPDSNRLNLTSSTERTYELRLKTGPDVNTRQFVYEEGGDGNGLSIEIQGGRIYFNAWSNSNGWNTVSASAAINPDTIYHVAGVYHQPSGEMRMYLNGALQTTSTGAAAMASHGDNVALGAIDGSTRDHTHTRVTSGSYFGGLISEFRAWNNARTQAQIENDKGEDSLAGSESGLIVLYNIDEGSGTTLNDSTANNIDGTIGGATWTTV